MNPACLTVGGMCDDTCTVDCGHCKGDHTRFAPECYHCEKPIIGAPVTDLGDQAWLPKAQWRTWCTEDCHVASAEKAEAS